MSHTNKIDLLLLACYSFNGIIKFCGGAIEQMTNEIEQAPEVIEPVKDWLLESLVSGVNKTAAEMGITLSVGGAVISGKMISGMTYAKLLADSIRSANDSLESIATALETSFGSIYNAEQPSQNVSYIHLKDIKVLSGNNWPELKGGLWRGRLTAVDGFIIGNV